MWLLSVMNGLNAWLLLQLNYFHQIRRLKFFVKYLKLKATKIQFGKIKGQNEKLWCTCSSVWKLKCLVLNVRMSLFLHPDGLKCVSCQFIFLMLWHSILLLLYSLIWYKIETIWNQKFYRKWGTFNCKQVAMWQPL
jgi:hypothetical protein